MRVLPRDAEPWIYAFYPQGKLANGVFSYPDGRSICAVIGGEVSLFPAENLDSACALELDLVTGVLLIPERELMVFAGAVDLEALGGMRFPYR